MYNLRDTNLIFITRGNSLDIAIGLTDNTTGKPYILQEGDTVLLTVKYHGDTVIQKVLTKEDYQDPEDTELLCSIEPSETIDLVTGEHEYDCLLVTSGGTANTFVRSTLVVNEAIGTYKDLGGDADA